MTLPAQERAGGFGVVELLVALVIASIIVVGIGALFTAAGNLQDRTNQTSRVMAALVDLQASATLASEETDLTIVGPSANGFALRRASASSHDAQVIVAIALQGDQHFLELSRGARLSSVDLSVFEQVSLEYFAPDAKARLWGDWNEVDSSIAAVRLVLTLGSRVWRPLVWVGDIYK